MKARIAELIALLRRAGVAVSVAEAIDAAQAAAVAGIARAALREALAATLVKDEADRPTFLAGFDAVFPLPAAAPPRAKRGRRSAGAAGAASGGARSSGAAEATTPAAGGRAGARPASPTGEGEPEQHERATARTASDAGADAEPADADHDDVTERDGAADHEAAADGDDAAERDGGRARAAVAHARRLQRLPFRAMTPADVEACADLARALAARVTARVRRRLAPRATGRLDFRRTIRAAVPRGGVPFERRYRGRRPGAPDLVALCDLSASTAVATEFFLALLAPAASYFRRVRLFGYVDRLVEIEFVGGHVRPAAAIDLMARSDFGRVLKDLNAEPTILGADTVLLVLGDARNNRRPPRPDLLAAARARARRLLWLNPEPRERWNTGDSVIAIYARYADAVVECGTLAELERALAVVAKL